MIRKLMQSYYAKISLACICIVILITGVFTYLCYGLISRQNVSEHLGNYNILANNQSAALSSRMASFSDFFHPVFNNPQAYEALCELYLSPNGSLPNETTDVLLDTMNALCASDPYCCGMLLLTRTGRLYQYDTQYVSLIPLNFVRTTFRFTPYQIQIITDSQISELSDDMDLPASHVYGLSGTLFRYNADRLENLGYMIALYSTEEFSNILASSNLENTAEFTIADSAFSVIYSSDDNYGDADIENLLAQPFRDTINNARLISDAGEDYYISSLYQNSYGYYTIYALPAENILPSTAQVSLLLLGLLLPLLCILLYSTVFRSSGRKVRNILKSMEIVGRNNLSYRMPTPRSNDEFASITHSFNHMCDELQKNVENVYLFEISQRKSELYAMQTSINPHFLYNTLNTIKWMAIVSKADNIASCVTALGNLLQPLFRNTKTTWPLSEELNYLKNYLCIMNYRTGEPVVFTPDIDSSVLGCTVPKFILQPLLENAVSNFNPSSEIKNSISLTGSRRENEILLRLQDNGLGIPAAKLALLQNLLASNEDCSAPLDRASLPEGIGIGILNTNRRIKLQYGNSSGLTIDSSEGIGTTITITLKETS